MGVPTRFLSTPGSSFVNVVKRWSFFQVDLCLGGYDHPGPELPHVVHLVGPGLEDLPGHVLHQDGVHAVAPVSLLEARSPEQEVR